LAQPEGRWIIDTVRRDHYYQELARDLRRNMTPAEKRVWSKLRAHRMNGFKFRRQHAIGRYIVDFVCLDARLVIEIDGDSHGYDAREALDVQRTAFLEKQGFHVLRFWNHHVHMDLASVTETIYFALHPDEDNPRPSPQPSPLRGEGDSVA
jgi:very-short-patch-repair endonuclease